MKHITLTTVDTGFFTNTSKKVTINPDHIISIEPDGSESEVFVYQRSEPYRVKESEEEIRKLIAAGEVKPAQPASEPPK